MSSYPLHLAVGRPEAADLLRCRLRVRNLHSIRLDGDHVDRLDSLLLGHVDEVARHLNPSAQVVNVSGLLGEAQALLELRDDLLDVGAGAFPGEQHIIYMRVNDHDNLALVCQIVPTSLQLALVYLELLEHRLQIQVPGTAGVLGPVDAARREEDLSWLGTWRWVLQRHLDHQDAVDALGL